MGCVNTKDAVHKDVHNGMENTVPVQKESIPKAKEIPVPQNTQEILSETAMPRESVQQPVLHEKPTIPSGKDGTGDPGLLKVKFAQEAEPITPPESNLPVTEEVAGVDTDDHVLSVEVPGGGYKITFASLSKRGYYPEAPDKANQDSFFVGPRFGGDPNDHLFGVYDGHGEHGTPCSQFARDRVGQNLLRHRLFKSDVPQAFHGSFVSANAQLHRSPIDDTMSGTTGITVLLRNRMLFAANVGDSRAIIAERKGKKLVAVDLSNDQTPYREDECVRVKACGARVLTLDQLEGLKNPHVKVWGGEDDDEGDPPRLWVPNGMYPGTAFTRSLGDTVAERIGVTAVPEVMVLPLTEQHSFIVVASDGVTEFLSSQAVVDMVAKHKNPYEACKALVDESYRLWLQYETRTDDITIIVIKLEGLSNPPPESPRSHHGLPSPVGSPSGRSGGKGRRRAVEGSLVESRESEGWVPPSTSSPKTPQEQARLQAALKSNFLFQTLSEKQRSTLVRCMEKLEVKAGDIVIRQGETGDKFYCCEEGEYEILVSSDQNQSLGSVVHRYTSGSRPCFGDLALLYETRREASVRAATPGHLWTLDRRTFKAVQRLEAVGSLPPSDLPLLRSNVALAALPLAQLAVLASKMQVVTFKAGDVLASSDQPLDRFYLVKSGEVELKVPGSRRTGSSSFQDRPEPRVGGTEVKGSGSHVGEWILLGTKPQPVTATVKSPTAVLLAIGRLQFEAAVGPLAGLAKSQERLRVAKAKWTESQSKDPLLLQLAGAHIPQLDWEETIVDHDCFQLGRVRHKTSGASCTLKQWSKAWVQGLGRSEQALRERQLFLHAAPASPFLPALLARPVSTVHVGLLLHSRLATPLSLLALEPLPHEAARHVAASLLLAIQHLHQSGIVYRGVSMETVFLDDSGCVQLADLRFAKPLPGDGRTFTMCGSPDYLAPEMIAGTGHGQAVDWWAFGVFIYIMLTGEGPFGTWRDSELQIYTRISRRQLNFPDSLGKARELVDGLLAPKPEERLGCSRGGIAALKSHSWFSGVDWDELELTGGAASAPAELMRRIALARKRLPSMDKGNAYESRVDNDASSLNWFDGW